MQYATRGAFAGSLAKPPVSAVTLREHDAIHRLILNFR
jgi:hypothetical protein